MKLYFDGFSPCARKVRMAASELGLHGRIELVEVDFNLTEGERWDHCPIGIIPTLIADDGATFYDSKLCCEYLETLAGGASLWPSDPSLKWEAKRLHMLADNMIDYSMSMNAERTRPEIMRLEIFLERNQRKLIGGLNGMEALIGKFGEDNVTMGEIATACCLAHIDYWREHLDWRDRRPALAQWFDEFSQRPSFRDTQIPTGPYKGLMDPNFDTQSEATLANIKFAQDYALSVAKNLLAERSP